MEDLENKVINRLSGDAIVCPDCGEVLASIAIERYHQDLYHINYDSKQLEFVGSIGDSESPAYRCPHCDTLNVDEIIGRRFRIKEEVKTNGNELGEKMGSPV